MFRLRFLGMFVALLSFAAVTDQSLARFSVHREATCSSQNDTSDQNQKGGSCDCICHQGLVGTLSSTRTELAPTLTVGLVAEHVQQVTEAPTLPIDLPPQLA